MMETKQTSESVFGKPTIELQNHDQNYGQRESTHAGGKGGKPTLGPETHDANYGQRDVLDEEWETDIEVEIEVDIEESRGARTTGDDVEESRGKGRADSDIEEARGGRHGEDYDEYVGETGMITDDREVE